MKITIEVDCTPQEARAFFGMPDVTPLNEALVARLQEQMGAAMSSLGPEALVKLWVPLGAQGIDQLQKLVFGALRGSGESGGETPSRPRKG